MMLVKAKMM